MKNPAYQIIKAKIESGETTEFDQIFDYISRQEVEADLEKTKAIKGFKFKVNRSGAQQKGNGDHRGNRYVGVKRKC